MSGPCGEASPSDPFNEYGFAIRAKAKLVNISISGASYMSKREKRSSTGTSSKRCWYTGSSATMEKKYTHPTIPFVNKSQDIDNYYPPGSLQIGEKDDSVTWSSAAGSTSASCLTSPRRLPRVQDHRGVRPYAEIYRWTCNPRTHHPERVHSGPAGVHGGLRPELDAGLSATTSCSTLPRTRAIVVAG